MLKVLLLMLYILSINININAIAEDSIKKEDIVTIFKRSMNHWKINYETLDENKSGAACIPWNTIDKTFPTFVKKSLLFPLRFNLFIGSTKFNSKFVNSFFSIFG